MKLLTNIHKSALLVLATLLISSCASAGKNKKIEYLFYKNAGDEFPINQVIDIEGRTVDLTDNAKRKLVILFATWCSDSQRALAALSQSEILNEQGLEIIAIAREEDVEKVTNFKNEKGYGFNMAADPNREIYSKFANAGIPRFIMVDENNIIVDHVIAEGENQLDKIHWNK